MRRLVAAVLAGLVSGAALASDCGDLTTQGEMNRCMADQYRELDRQLNAVYSSYRARLDPQQRGDLKAAQEAWVRFRDVDCAFEASGSVGGSVHPFVEAACLAAKTKARLEDLRRYSTCSEGDVSCPSPR